MLKPIFKIGDIVTHTNNTYMRIFKIDFIICITNEIFYRVEEIAGDRIDMELTHSIIENYRLMGATEVLLYAGAKI